MSALSLLLPSALVSTLLLGGLQACTSDKDAAAVDAAAEAAASPPVALRSVRHGSLFIRRCWFSSFTPEQIASLGRLSTDGATRESGARAQVATRYLDLNEALANKVDPVALDAAATAVAQAERDQLHEEFGTLAALVGVLGAEQMGSGGKESAVLSLQESLTTHTAFSEEDPFTRADVESGTDEEIARLVQVRIELDRSFLAFSTVLSAEGTKIASLDVTGKDWAAAYEASEKSVLDAWLSHRTRVAIAYARTVQEMPDLERDKLLLKGGVRSTLQLPSAAEATGMEGGGPQGGPGMGGQGGGPGMGGGPQGGEGMQGGGPGMGGQGGMGGGPGMQGGGQGMQGGGPGMQGGGQGMQGGGPGMQGGGQGTQGGGPGAPGTGTQGGQ